MILKTADWIHKNSKERDENLRRSKIVNAITDQSACTPESIQEHTSLNESEINGMLRTLEEEGYISCNYGGSRTSCWSFEVLKELN